MIFSDFIKLFLLFSKDQKKNINYTMDEDSGQHL